MLASLLDNAMIHGAPRDSEIAVAMDFTAKAASLGVEDDGPGIPTDLRERVFDRVFCAEVGGGTGCGLGLAIARDAALAHGGTVRLVPGMPGARFEAILPLA
ncbi:ATP-binding protein [Profundibacterium mesophilum]|uniref:histidine kinase n=1 Tax=Profundibacterium mesophilum KAUST100406-0324 TaxID=1037889 RepID=A0A921NY41_9RHOB|nr:ATP-binding protein [Profundibacterium mesophilum]KAF0676854.1 two-component system OmpR family sensor histidine kinase TctE [Profundibacterium mesophilum KAUST100406-0324]